MPGMSPLVLLFEVRRYWCDCKSRFVASRLKELRLFCQLRLHSTLILTHRKMISSPPLKSMPSCTTSPSFTGNARDSVPGEESRTWLRKVPEEDLTSLTYHCPELCQNSQCRRDTTLDLKPTGRIATSLAPSVAFSCVASAMSRSL